MLYKACLLLLRIRLKFMEKWDFCKKKYRKIGFLLKKFVGIIFFMYLCSLK